LARAGGSAEAIGEPVTGVADVHIHPLEPISARINIAKSF
jgi:hypothetical protein